MTEQIIILDSGSKYTRVIARRIRECRVFSQILRFNTPASKLMAPRSCVS
jgi:GMP synthase (glutamine-hydrolysing)